MPSRASSSSAAAGSRTQPSCRCRSVPRPSRRAQPAPAESPWPGSASLRCSPNRPPRAAAWRRVAGCQSAAVTGRRRCRRWGCGRSLARYYPRPAVFGGCGLSAPHFGRSAIGASSLESRDPQPFFELAGSALRRPDVVVNAGAYTAVDKAESDADAARTINALSPGAVARVMADRGGWLVHFSTDYVFDGSGDQARDEAAPTGPLSVYGRPKLECEALIAASGCRHLILRTSWVHAARGGNFARTMQIGRASGR